MATERSREKLMGFGRYGRLGRNFLAILNCSFEASLPWIPLSI
jgi:hypothetical protein